jgi:hypothetical protein
VHGIFLASASSFMDIDGVAATPANVGSNSWASAATVLANVNGTPLNGYITEAGLWNIGFSTGQATSMCHNQYLYWGTAVSC